METITRIPAFTGNPEIETAISERLGYTGDYIDDNGLVLPDGSDAPEDWPCAIFKPEANMYGFDLSCEFDGTLFDKDSCAEYNLPKGTETAVYMGLTGTRSAIEGFCQNICNMSGMTCHLMEDTDDGYKLEKTLSPSGTPRTTDEFLDLMFEAYEW